jgi:hypothetical protein
MELAAEFDSERRLDGRIRSCVKADIVDDLVTTR